MYRYIILLFIFFFTGTRWLNADDPDTYSVKKIAGGFRFTEGPCVREDGSLVFSDVEGNTVYSWSEKTGAVALLKPSGNANGLANDLSGRLLIAQQGSRRLARLEPDGTITILAAEYRGKKLNSPNDIAVRFDGLIFFTDPDFGVKKQDRELSFMGIYSLNANTGELVLLNNTLDKPNGLVFSPDEKLLYVVETFTRKVHVFHVDVDGLLSDRKVFVSYPGKGVFDGMGIDSHGNLYVAYSEGYILVFSAEGTLLKKVSVPERPRNVTCADDGVLYITAGTSIYQYFCK